MSQTMQAVFVHGNDQGRVDYTPSADVVCGQVVNLGNNLIGVITSSEGIASGVLGSVATAGVFSFLKDVDATTFSAGDIAGWDEAVPEAVNDDDVASDYLLGSVVEDAGATDPTVKVLITNSYNVSGPLSVKFFIK